MFDPCFPKVPEGSFGETSGLTTPNFPGFFLWRGCLGCAGGGPPYEFGAFQVGNHRENGGFQPKFFPRVFFRGPWEKGFIFNKLRTTPTPNKNGSYGIEGGVRMP